MNESSVGQQPMGRRSAGCDCIPCPGFGVGWSRSPATGPHGREEVARLGSRSKPQLLVPQFLPSWGWDVNEGWLAAFPPTGREMSPGEIPTAENHVSPRTHLPGAADPGCW